MKKLQGGKVLLFSLVLLATLALVTWAFLSFRNGLLASTTTDEEIKEQEVKVKILDKDSEDTDTPEEPVDESEDILTSPRFPDAQEFDDIRKEFEKTQREMQEIVEEMRRSRTQIIKDLMGDIEDEDFPGWKDFTNRDDWDMTPRFQHTPRTPWRWSGPDDFTIRLWGRDSPEMPGLGLTSTAMDVRDYKERIVVKCDLPGMDKDKIEVTLKGRELTVEGTREVAEERTEEENGGRAVICERSFGRFSRTITLPRNIDPDKITSKYEDGVLEIIVPKLEPDEPEEKKIIIETE
jgi:HSP20 family molecular chaperone IbpA